MPRTNLPHIIVSDWKASRPYQSVGRGGGEKRPVIGNKPNHVHSLINRFSRLNRTARLEQANREAKSLPTKDGFYIRLRSFKGFRLSYEKLELKSLNIRVVHHREYEEDGDKIEEAILYIPFSAVRTFLDRLYSYRRDVEQDNTEKASQRDLVEYISSIKSAVFDQFWQDPEDLKPTSGKTWTEVWIWTDDLTTTDSREERIAIVKNICDSLKIEYKDESLNFTERSVMMVYGNEDDLRELLRSSDYISEFRLAKSTVQFFADLEPDDQKEACENLIERLQISKNAAEIAITILDGGVNREHILLEKSLAKSDRHTIKEEWGVADNDGHGTEMAGLALFGNLSNVLETSDTVILGHILESSKFLPPEGKNPKELYGTFTKQAVSIPAIEEPDRKRIFNMAVSANDDIDRGRPSSWSAAVDEICFNEKVLFMISAGNNNDSDLWKQYPLGNLLSPVQDPGQSWNSITVGAYTQLNQLSDPNLANYEVIAENGQLSPYSTTGNDFESQWPVKPDVVFEGGNLMRAPDGAIYFGEDDLSLLTTAHNINEQLFSSTYATSAATAQASEFAARLQRAYSDFWPETIRGLIIHSAEWKEGMYAQFKVLGIDLSKKSGYQKALKMFGYGVPSFQRARHSADNSLTLIAEAEIQPFIKDAGNPLFNEFHIYELPWPKEELLAMGETPVELKITLSYYVEPMPGNRGNKDKYRYASHQLEFQISQPGDDVEKFSLRMGEKLEEQEYSEARKRISHQEDRWEFGVNSRNSGSIHSDKMNLTAADMADCNLIAVYPKTGWWYTRTSQKRYNDSTRYSLIVTLSTPDEEVDLYSPIETQVEIEETVQVEGESIQIEIDI